MATGAKLVNGKVIDDSGNELDQSIAGDLSSQPVQTPATQGMVKGLSTNSQGAPVLEKSNLIVNIPKSQVPTDTAPVVTIGASTKNPAENYYGKPFNELTDREKDISIQFKKARERSEFKNLTDDELAFEIGKRIPEAPAAVNSIAGSIITDRQSEYDQTEKDLAARREELIKQQEDVLNKQFERDSGLVREGQQQRERASQSRFSFSGFGRSTENDAALEGIAKDANQQIEILNARKNSELALYKAELEGADEQRLSGIRDQIDTLRLQEDTLKMQNAAKIAELNAANKVTGMDAVSNMLNALGIKEGSGYDKELTELINDGYIYKLGVNGIPQRLMDSSGNDIKTGVNEGGDFQYVPPLQNPLTGTLITPGYAFDKNTATLYEVLSNGESVPINGDEQSMKAYKDFSEYTNSIGNGTVVKGSPYHKGLEVDIDGNKGDIITAFSSGTIKKIEDNKNGYGKSVVIEDRNGNTFRYAHLDSFLAIKEGQPVGSGFPLGTMGNTGNVIALGRGDGSHLHIEARDKNGNLIPVDSLDPNDLPTESSYGSSNKDDIWAAEAILKGYNTKDLIQGYLLAKQQGVTLPDQASAKVTQQNLDNVTNLITKFKPLNDEVTTLEEGFSVINGFNFNHTNPATDQALIFSFMKVLDPGSVVRENEFTVAKNNTSLLNSLAANWTQAIEGTGMITVEQRKNIVKEMKRIYKNKREIYTRKIDQAKTLGKEFNIDPNLYLFDFKDFEAEAAPSIPSSGNASDPLGIK